MRLAGTSTRAPVFGLRPTRGCRWRVRKLPKPRISILSPPRRDRTTLSKMASTITSESLRVISTTRETSSINSALVMLSAFPFSSSVHRFFDSHGCRRGLALIILQTRAFLILGHSTKAQADFLVRLAHLDNLEIVLIADGQRRIAGGPFFTSYAFRHGRDLGLVAQRFHSGPQFHKHAECRGAAHPAPHQIPDFVGAEKTLPGVGLKLLDSEGKPPIGSINVQDHRLHHLPL